MCFAPRYIKGTMARPSRPCRNTASFPDTPCASSVVAITRTTLAAMIAVMGSGFLLRTLVFLMAGVTGFVEVAARGEHAIRVLLIGRGQRGFAGRDEALRERHPLSCIDHTTADEHHVAGFDDRRRAVANRRPLL